jgi:hypothetical protein
VKFKDVKVRAILNDAGGIEFEVDGVKAKHARLKLDKDSGAHTIDFKLQDHSGRGVQFDTVNPIHVGENVPCPPPQGINSDQFGVTSCDAERLSTVNQNSGAARELRYQLNFVAADGSQLDCDPIIDNGGGTAI